MNRKFLLGFVVGLLLSVLTWPGCKAVDHAIGNILHQAHGGEAHDQ